MEQLILSRRFEVTSADVDMFKRLRPGALVNMLIQAAITSADELGFGFGQLSVHNLVWVLSRLQLEIYDKLTIADIVTVETWPKNIDKLLYLRDFTITKPDGSIVAKATSAWLAIDCNTRRPKIINQQANNVFTHHKNKHAINATPEKLLPFVNDSCYYVNPVYCDFDLNGHVTSTRYIDWVFDSLSLDFNSKNYPKVIVVNYIKEVLPNQTIFLNKLCNPGGVCMFDGFNSFLNTTAYRAKIIF